MYTLDSKRLKFSAHANKLLSVSRSRHSILHTVVTDDGGAGDHLGALLSRPRSSILPPPLGVGSGVSILPESQSETRGDHLFPTHCHSLRTSHFSSDHPRSPQHACFSRSTRLLLHKASDHPARIVLKTKMDIPWGDCHVCVCVWRTGVY